MINFSCITIQVIIPKVLINCDTIGSEIRTSVTEIKGFNYQLSFHLFFSYLSALKLYNESF